MIDSPWLKHRLYENSIFHYSLWLKRLRVYAGKNKLYHSYTMVRLYYYHYNNLDISNAAHIIGNNLTQKSFEIKFKMHILLISSLLFT